MVLKTGLTGFEPATSAVTGRCSNQLNYNPLCSAAELHLLNRIQLCTSPLEFVKHLVEVSIQGAIESVFLGRKPLRKKR
jgi:hypothetical protein